MRVPSRGVSLVDGVLLVGAQPVDVVVGADQHQVGGTGRAQLVEPDREGAELVDQRQQGLEAVAALLAVGTVGERERHDVRDHGGLLGRGRRRA